MEMVVCFASSSVICFGAHPKNAPDMIISRRIIVIECRLSILEGIEIGVQRVFLTSAILHLIWAE